MAHLVILRYIPGLAICNATKHEGQATIVVFENFVHVALDCNGNTLCMGMNHPCI
jgi:hypothetical protein